VRVVLHRLGQGAVGLLEGSLGRVRDLGERTCESVNQEAMRLLAQRKRAGLAAGAHDAARAGREGAEVLGLATGGAGGQLRRETGGQQQLQPERERLRAARVTGVGVEQSELVAEEVVGGRVRLGGVEEAEDRLTRLRAALERGAVLPDAGVGMDGVRLADRAELAATLVHDEPDSAERLEPAAETRLHTPHSLGNSTHAAAIDGVKMQHAIGLAIANRAQNNGFSLERAGHYRAYTLMWMADENGVVYLYTTEPCGFCRQAKTLLQARGVDYREVNLAKDPEGRAALVALTGQMTFPQIVVGERSIGGFRELLEADRAGMLDELLAA
jgi:glutaredoxin 3